MFVHTFATVVLVKLHLFEISRKKKNWDRETHLEQRFEFYEYLKMNVLNPIYIERIETVKDQRKFNQLFK